MDSTPYLNTLSIRLGTTLGKIEHYVNRVVSQSESNITSPESSANQNRVLRHPSRTPESSLRHPRALGAWATLLGSRLESAPYSLS